MKVRDLQVALKKAQPAALREGFATVPTTTWADIGALQHVQAEMEKAILVSSASLLSALVWASWVSAALCIEQTCYSLSV